MFRSYLERRNDKVLDLTTAKLVAHDFDTNSFKRIYNYLSNRKQRIKVNRAYSIYKDIFYGVL